MMKSVPWENASGTISPRVEHVVLVRDPYNLPLLKSNEVAATFASPELHKRCHTFHFLLSLVSLLGELS